MAVDWISVTQEKIVLIVGAKKSTTGYALKQIMLSLKDAWGNNNEEGKAYSLIQQESIGRWLRIIVRLWWIASLVGQPD